MSSGRNLPCTRTRGELFVVMWRSLPPISIIFFSNSLSVMPAMVASSPDYKTVSLFHRCHACRDFDQPASPQRDHSLFDRFLFQFQGRSAHQDQLAQFVVDLHHFIQTRAPFVPALIARGASLAVINLGCFGFLGRIPGVNQRLFRHFQFFLAIHADAPHQALRANQVDGSRDQKGLYAHVHQTADGRGRIVRVQRREHQVPGQRRLYPDFRRLEVANLSHQDDVGVLPEEGAQRRREVQPDLLLHLHLVDPRQLELHGVLRGHDVRLHLIQPGHRGVQRIRFAGSRGPGHQHHAIGPQNVALEFLQRLRLETQLGHVQPQVFLVQQPQHDLFAEQRGHRGHAEVQFLFSTVDFVLDHDAAVLRQPLFRDVQLRHDLQAAGHGIAQLQRRIHHRLQHPVDAEPHPHLVLVRLHVNIARAPLHRIRQDQVHQLDDGRLFGGSLQRRCVQLLLFGSQLQFLVFVHQILHQVAEFFVAGGAAAVEPRDGFADRRFRRHHRLHVEPGHELDVVHREHVRGIRHRDGQHGAHAGQRHHLIAQRGVLRDQLNYVGIDFVILQVDGRYAVLPRKHTGDVIIGDIAHLRQAAPQLATIRALKFQRLIELVLRDKAFL